MSANVDASCIECARIRDLIVAHGGATPLDPLVHGRECHWDLTIPGAPDGVYACVSAWSYPKDDGSRGWSTSAAVLGPGRSGRTTIPADAALLRVAEEVRVLLDVALGNVMRSAP
jgi:hypothetical protein